MTMEQRDDWYKWLGVLRAVAKARSGISTSDIFLRSAYMLMVTGSVFRGSEPAAVWQAGAAG